MILHESRKLNVMWMQTKAQWLLQLLFVIIKGVALCFLLAIYAFSPSIRETERLTLRQLQATLLG